jgi:hypothetical protein
LKKDVAWCSFSAWLFIALALAASVAAFRASKLVWQTMWLPVRRQASDWMK